MIEVATNTRTAQAYRAAHAERSAVFVAIFGWIFRKRHVPLSRVALTEPPRCA
ncbi:hypothetical protein [Shimia abyssi]|uniref:Uncharacterized protein n=1 Tax=Shimia abyssi TaxID=1662395 RepID=A0A2P8FGV9_9RHOB|nr:hypothetical protein [Shimia abyssi]PSL20935.1 hypothetical protein CLV88_10254 [Shimia abyssi]